MLLHDRYAIIGVFQKSKGVTPIAIRIVTDSTCDLSPEDQIRLDVQVIPLTVHFSGVSYLDGIELTKENFYHKLETNEKLPTTSQISPQTFTDAFEKHLEAGDEVVGIFISGEISGTYDSSCIAKKMLNSDKLFMIDSRSATMGLALLVSEAAKKRDAGCTANEIAEHITGLTKKIRFLAAVNTLKYLRKGGRISAASAMVGEVLGVKPIVTIQDGSIHSIGKARGMNAALKSILDRASKDFPDLRYEVAFAHSLVPDLAQKAIEMFKEPLQLTDWITCSIGSVIGTYSGKGAIGFAYIAQ